jgi:raffinose/stachyose/melibiose transport system permease protein
VSSHTRSAKKRELTAQEKKYEKKARSGYGRYLILGSVGTVVVLLIPFVINIWISLFNWRGGFSKMRWVGLGNYSKLLHDAKFWTSFSNSLYMIVAMVIIPTLIGLILSAVLFDYIGQEFGGKTSSFLRACYYIPQILPVGVAGILWNWILNSQTGAINRILSGMFGVANPPDWLGDPSFAIYAVMLMLIWSQIGYPVVIFMSALGRVDPELYEAAALDGAGWWKRFKAITLPQIKPEVFVVVLTCTVAALKVFGPVYVLTKGGPQSSTLVPSYYSYINFFGKSQIGYGAAIASVLAILIAIVASVILIFQNRSAAAEREGARV